jgi:hypothetical protein
MATLKVAKIGAKDQLFARIKTCSTLSKDAVDE